MSCARSTCIAVKSSDDEDNLAQIPTDRRGREHESRCGLDGMGLPFVVHGTVRQNVPIAVDGSTEQWRTCGCILYASCSRYAPEPLRKTGTSLGGLSKLVADSRPRVQCSKNSSVDHSQHFL